MLRAKLNESFDSIIHRAGKELAASGFRRQGPIFRLVRLGNAGLIEFQKSVESSNERILFTINLAVIQGRLLRPDQPSLDKARSLDAHLRQRIGALLPGRPDKWWEVTISTDIDGLTSEISDMVRKGAQYVARYLDTNDLIALWESGKSPGLTEVQRGRYLDELKSKR